MGDDDIAVDCIDIEEVVWLGDMLGRAAKGGEIEVGNWGFEVDVTRR